MPPGNIHESRPGAVTLPNAEVVQVGDAVTAGGVAEDKIKVSGRLSGKWRT
jgi:hypothetical protein